MGRGKRTMQIHERLILSVLERMQGNGYSGVVQNWHYTSIPSQVDGEFDILAIKSEQGEVRYAIIVEVKSTKHRRAWKKAVSQLEKNCRRVRELYGPQVRCFKLFIYQNKQRLRKGLDRPYFIEWVR